MRIITTFLAVILFRILGFSQGNVDGFFKGKNVCDVALSGAYQHSDKYVRGESTVINYTRDLTVFNLFAEYGITDKFDAFVNIPFINGSFQDMSIFAKYKVASIKNLDIIPAAGVSFPLSNYTTQSGQAIGQRATIIQPKLVLQWKYKGYFIQAQGGYNYALDPVPSSVPASVKVGWGGAKIYTDLWFDYQYGIGGEDYFSNSVDFRELGVSYQKVGGVFFYSFTPKIGAFVNYSYIFAGRNTGLAYTFGAGIVYKIKKDNGNS